MAVGVELLHTASLVHDDIVDDSDTRRGAATLYARVGNALAVLVGDYLFSQAAQECVATGDLQRGAAVRRDARRDGAGPDRRCQRPARRSPRLGDAEPRRYFRTIAGKTASLFVLACQGTGPAGRHDQPQVAGAARVRRESGPGLPGRRRHPRLHQHRAGAGQTSRQRPAPGHDHPAGHPAARPRAELDGRYCRPRSSQTTSIYRCGWSSRAAPSPRRTPKPRRWSSRAQAALAAAAAGHRTRRARRAGDVRDAPRANR